MTTVYVTRGQVEAMTLADRVAVNWIPPPGDGANHRTYKSCTDSLFAVWNSPRAER
jgi:hypothetical protein